MTTTGKALETLFEMCEESNASDLHLAVGLHPAQLKQRLDVVPELVVN